MSQNADIRSVAHQRLIVAAISALLLMSALSALKVVTVEATPTVPPTISNGNPVNVIWRGYAYPGIVGSALLEAGWVWGDQMNLAGAYYMLMWQDGSAARWYLWIYDGGSRDPDWGYWSYASAAHYYWNILGNRWALDDLEGAEAKVYNTWAATSLPWTTQYDYYWMNNAGSYGGVNNDGNARRFTVAEAASGEGQTQWTTNPAFTLNDPANKWDLVNYEWDWGPQYSGTTWAVPNTDTHFATWPSDRTAWLSAYDQTADTIGQAARVTYGPFNIQGHNYPYPEPYRLPVSSLDKLTVKGVIALAETGLPVANEAWTGVKFDAWFSDPANGGRPMVIEMYFVRTGLNNLWEFDPTAFFRSHNEVARYLSSGTIDDYLISLWEFPSLCNSIGKLMNVPNDINPNRQSGIATFVIDLQAMWQRARTHFTRSDSDQLYAIALDLESSMGTIVPTKRVFAVTSEIRVTYTGRQSLRVNLREHKVYSGYNPDIRFLKPSSSVLRIDSYQSGTSSMGYGWAFIVVPRMWLDGRYIRFRWSGYFSYSGARIIAGAYIYDGQYDASNDADFPTAAGIPIKGAGRLQTLAEKNVAYGWSYETVDVRANVAAGTQSKCTIFFLMSDAWIQQSVYVDIDWFQVNAGAAGSGPLAVENFNAAVVMQRTGTYGDYGYISTGQIGA